MDGGKEVPLGERAEGRDHTRHKRVSRSRSPRGWQLSNDARRRRSRSRSPDQYYAKRRRINHFEPYGGRPRSPERFGRPEFGPMFDHPPPSFSHPVSDHPVGLGPFPPFKRPLSPYTHASYEDPSFDLMCNRMPFECSPIDRSYCRSSYDRLPPDCSQFDHPSRERLGFERPPFIHPSVDRHPYDRSLNSRSHQSSPAQLRDPQSTIPNRNSDSMNRRWQGEPARYSSPNFPEGTNTVSEADFADEISLLRADGMDVENGNRTTGQNMSQRNKDTYNAGNWSGQIGSTVNRGRFCGRGNPANVRVFGRGNRGRGVTGGATGNTGRGRGHGAINHTGRGGINRSSSTAQSNGSSGNKVTARGRGRPAPQFQPSQNKVHSLANIKQPDAANMSLAEKLHRFGLFLRNETLKENSIQTVENALTACKLNLRSHYEACELLKYAGRPMFTGCLYIGGQFIIRAVGATKKELKHDVYSQALSILTTNSVVDILGKRDQGLGVIREELLESLKSTQQENMALGTKDSELLSSDPADSHNSSLKNALLPLVHLMKTKPVSADNKISILEQSISMSHCTFKSNFTCEEGKLLNGKRTFRVLLCLGNILISEGRGMKKKDAKHAAYANAVTALTTRSLDDLVTGENVEGSSAEEWTQLDQTQGAESTSHKASKKNIKDVQLNLSEGFSLEKQFTKLVDGLKDSSFKMNNVNSIDCLAVQLALSPVCYYRKVEIIEDVSTLIACDLYINNIFLGTGESNTKKDAQIEAYHKAWELLTTTSPTILLTEQPKKLASDPPDPSVFDKVVKGSGKYGDSNLERLNRLKIDVYKDWKRVKDLVIMEHSDWVADRERHAFCILNQSATFSGLLMEWAFTGMQGGVYECSINIQNEQVGYGKASTKQAARGQASQMAMNRFYRTQPVVQVVRRDESKLWLSWEDFKAQAERWEPPEGYMEGIPLNNSTSSDAASSLNARLIKYGTFLMEQQLKQDNLEDVIFGPGIPGPEYRALTHQALRLHMKVDSNHSSAEAYAVISRKMPPDELMSCLRRNGGRSGKYLLLSEKDRPTLVVTRTTTDQPGTSTETENGDENPSVTEVVEEDANEQDENSEEQLDDEAV
ncbi:uncharacterized protein LOC135469601 [Liolophura sinensis]|uniref:uncharacterized protein LOC135469601 n=1 Tax=Liolophura sinensis TaxID=3198878 RepID=UPI0031598AD2